ncbi:MAG: DNA polymerase III subunit alpha [Rickettsiales bacterium]|jgi:DNA polymerase-3 subunit alpha
MPSPAFIHLRVHSDYSLLEGAIHVKDIVKWCKAEKMPAVAIADSGNLFASLEFSLAAAGEGVQPILACTLFIKPEAVQDSRHTNLQKPEQLIVYTQNETGWQNLLALVSKSFLQPAGESAPLLAMEDLEGKTEGLIALTGSIYGAVGKALIAGRDALAQEKLKKLQELFPERLYIELSRHGLPEEAQTEQKFIDLAYANNLPLVATNNVHFIKEDMFEAHDAFLCIADGTYVSEDNRRKLNPEHRFKTAAEMCELFADIPESLANSVVIAKRCAFVAQSRDPILPSFTIEGMSEEDSLRAQARKGLAVRLNGYIDDEEKRKPYLERLEFELDVIIRMKFPGYFLIVSDFITWSKEQGIPVGPGRGSGAGSVVAWALSITDLDPLRYGLLFERFLNPQRVSMPDFDIDFCQERRGEVINYVQQKYGTERVAQIITFGKLQARAVLRDVGRVLQMPYNQVDRICKLVPNNPAQPVTLEQALDIEPAFQAAVDDDEAVGKLLDISLKLEGFNRHASTHAAGVVIGDRVLSELVPMYRDPKSDMQVVQYSMKYAEAAGLVKFDFLGLKTLTVLVRAVHLVRNRGIEIDLRNLPEGDTKTYEMLGNGDTVGVFQLESAGMRDTLKKLKPDSLEDIIALVSLYRPGPMENIPTYIARKHGDEKPLYQHPLLEQVLKETFGVIIYQEQVMQIAQLLAGYTLGEADLLRRAMGKKIKSEMEAQRGIFVDRSVERGVPRKVAASIFDLIAKFAEYGFNKSHAAAYAVIAYQTAYLKANFPVEFIAASMTYDMGNTDKLSIFREDAGRFGIEVLPPDVNRSEVLFSVEKLADTESLAIRYALAAVRNVGASAMEGVVAERKKNGAYKDVFDFVLRIPPEALNRRAMEFLIKAGAFDALHPNRGELFANIELLMAHGTAAQRDRESQQVNLFGGADESTKHTPKLLAHADWSALEKLGNEFTAIGFYLSAHPLSGYSTAIEMLKVVPSNLLAEKLGEKYSSVKLAGIVMGRKFKSSDKGRFAFITLSDMGGIFEVSVFNEDLLSQQRENIENGNILLINADGKSEEAGVRLIAQSIVPLDEALMKQQRVRGGGQFRIVINQQTALPNLHSLLGSPASSGIQVRLFAQLENIMVEIELSGKYALSPATLDKIRVIKGVVTAEEIAA